MRMTAFDVATQRLMVAVARQSATVSHLRFPEFTAIDPNCWYDYSFVLSALSSCVLRLATFE